MEEVNKTIQFDGAHLELASEENNEKFMTFLEDHVTPDDILGKSIGFLFDEEMKIFFTERFKHEPVTSTGIRQNRGDNCL